MTRTDTPPAAVHVIDQAKLGYTDYAPLLRGEKTTEVKRESHFRVRLIITGSENSFAGYGLCWTPRHAMTRLVFQGPIVQGPHLVTFGLGSCIDDHGGTGAQIEREESAGYVVYANPGDVIEVGGDRWLITLDRRRFPVLKQVAVEQVHHADPAINAAMAAGWSLPKMICDDPEVFETRHAEQGIAVRLVEDDLVDGWRGDVELTAAELEQPLVLLARNALGAFSWIA